MIQAVIFDMDGVLVDTEEYICQAAIRFFDENGLQVKAEDFLDFVGMGENRYIGGVAEKYNFPIEIHSAKTRVYEHYHDIVRGDLKPLPGVLKFINRCKSKNLKLAVATSADKPKMLINLKESGLSSEMFDTLVNGLDLKRLKPHPDIFLIAAERLDIPPENCLVVEDAISGVQAAKAAGCRCLGLMTTFSQEELALADWISHTLEDAPEEVLEW
ncbi:MAG: HAD family hydrolase [bacterium]|jgi:beta-phosphoglucomutase